MVSLLISSPSVSAFAPTNPTKLLFDKRTSRDVEGTLAIIPRPLSEIVLKTSTSLFVSTWSTTNTLLEWRFWMACKRAWSFWVASETGTRPKKMRNSFFLYLFLLLYFSYYPFRSFSSFCPLTYIFSLWFFSFGAFSFFLSFSSSFSFSFSFSFSLSFSVFFSFFLFSFPISFSFSFFEQNGKEATYKFFLVLDVVQLYFHLSHSLNQQWRQVHFYW